MLTMKFSLILDYISVMHREQTERIYRRSDSWTTSEGITNVKSTRRVAVTSEFNDKLYSMS